LFYHQENTIHSKRFPHRVLMHVDFRGSYEDLTINKVQLKKLRLISNQNIPIEYLDDEQLIVGEFKAISHGQIDDDRGSRHHSYYNFVFDLPSFHEKHQKCFQLGMVGDLLSKKGNRVKKDAFVEKDIIENKICLKNGDFYAFQTMDLRIDFQKTQFKVITIDHQTKVPTRVNY
ncbi:hypothetical protein MJH12_19130, partial [bacterium]|nr:hypothetical protein [bacterium]